MSLMSYDNDEKDTTKLTSIALNISRKTDSDLLTSVNLGQDPDRHQNAKWKVGSGSGSALKGLGHQMD